MAEFHVIFCFPLHRVFKRTRTLKPKVKNDAFSFWKAHRPTFDGRAKQQRSQSGYLRRPRKQIVQSGRGRFYRVDRPPGSKKYTFWGPYSVSGRFPGIGAVGSLWFIVLGRALITGFFAAKIGHPIGDSTELMGTATYCKWMANSSGYLCTCSIRNTLKFSVY